MARRYYSERLIDEKRVELIGDEARHLTQVMRGRVGQIVVLFDGSGAEFDAKIQHVARAKVEFTIVGRREVDRESHAQLTLGVALPKGDRQRWLVEKAVELGVRRLIPLRSNRGVAQPAPSVINRLQRAVIAATKQCGRTRLMEVGASQEAAVFFATASQTTTCWIAHPGGQSLAALLDDLPRRPPPYSMAVGPEGGWTDDEVQAAVDSNWRRVDLGPRILRVETAALTLAALATVHHAADHDALDRGSRQNGWPSSR